jgi:sugar O-acyltransferase (sialic acid O-acetyltransferase NeuD family)
VKISSWQKVSPARKRIVMYGAADQARVNRPILEDAGCEIAMLVDDTPGLASPFAGVPIAGGWDGLSRWLEGQNVSELGFVVAIGNPYGHVRCALHTKLSGAGLTPVSFADSTALIRSSASFGEGLQVMPQAIIHNDATLGHQCLINTKALVEHDCVLEPGVEVGPGAILCGRVHVGANTWIGAGATIRPRVRIGCNSIIGAGAVVVSDIPSGVVAVGVPASPLPNMIPPSAQTT